MSQAFSVFLCLTLSLIIILKESQCGLPGAPGPPLLLVLYEGGRPPRLRQLALGLPGPHVGCLRYAPSHTRPCRFSAPGLGGGPREAPGGPNWQLVQKKSATFATRSGSPKLPHSGPPARGGPTGSPWGPELVTFAKEIRHVCDAERIPETAGFWTPRSGGAHGRPLGARIGHFWKRNPPRLRRRADPRKCRIPDPLLFDFTT